MNPKFITVHCSATRPKYQYTKEKLHRDHVARGFSDIGYHFYITRDGNLHPCRPLTKQGAQVKGHNKDNIGICLEGGLNNDTGKPEDNYTKDQDDQLRYLLTELQGKYGVIDDNVKGHRDWYGDYNGDGVIDSRDWLKECPCFDVKERYKEWAK